MSGIRQFNNEGLSKQVSHLKPLVEWTGNTCKEAEVAFKVINDGRLRADITRPSLCNVIFLFCQSKLKVFLISYLNLSSKVKF